MTPGALDADVRHGYCFGDIRKLAGYAAHRSYWVRAMPAQERFDLALSAIAESVLTAQERPGERDLVTAGIRAIDRDVTVRMKLDGIDANRPADNLGPNMANFCTYWFAHIKHVASHENAIVEAIAMSQILPRLKPRHQDVISALATHGTYDKAAESLGILNRHTFIAYLSLARKEFLSLWHEGQTPSHIWGKDCFGIEGYDRDESITVRTLRQRNARRGRRHKEPSDISSLTGLLASAVVCRAERGSWRPQADHTGVPVPGFVPRWPVPACSGGSLGGPGGA